MELLTVEIAGYKRFRARTSLKANGKLVALLGPNEAGKSSLLQALIHLTNDDPAELDEVSRGLSRDDLLVEGRFYLSSAELELADLDGPRLMIVTKKGTGQRVFSFKPLAPERDASQRIALVEALLGIEQQVATLELVQEYDADLGSGSNHLAEALQAGPESLDSAVMSALREMRSEFEAAMGNGPTTYGTHLLVLWGDVITHEAAPTPLNRAIEALKGHLPEFLIFDNAARDLASSYAISALRSEIPPALRNLAEVAELNFPELFDAIDNGQTARVTTIERRASRNLASKFKTAWRQSGIEVALRFNNDILEVQIVETTAEYTPLAERSDGLRQFVALQMFAIRNHASDPVLLIDEADQRLHYDAQADLVQMLARQTVARKVIYTTHSAGCLPEDLGNGVRTIVPCEQGGSSQIVNKFWTPEVPGLAPLLIGLGASTMAFFPTRRAVMVEGPSDMLLYPTLFREALGVPTIGFQFVPGLSQSSILRGLPLGKGVLFLVDGDPGGLSLKARLSKAGVPEQNLFVLSNDSNDALELEDYVREEHLLAATNSILAKWHPAVPLFTVLPSAEGRRRLPVLIEAFKEATRVKDFPKVDLAYELLDQLQTDPCTKLLDAQRCPAFTKVAQTIAAGFDKE